jgi:eukaryotic translation initiation factor 2C
MQLFFRDGISEGQFSHVLQGEVTAIRMAAAQAGQAVNKEGYAPKLTFICCGKRHHISLFPTNPRDGDVKTGNAKSGVS